MHLFLRATILFIAVLIGLSFLHDSFGAEDAFDEFIRDHAGSVAVALGAMPSSETIGLNVKNTDWASIPHDLAGMPSLRFLRIRGSQITLSKNDIDVLSQLPKLEYLEISSSRVDQVPDSLERLAYVETLILNRNSIGDQERWPRLGRLRMLSLAMNQIANVAGIDTLSPRLESLDLSTNRLRAIGEWLNGMRNLESLFLSRNEIAAIHASLPRRLKILDLRGNKIEEFPRGLVGPSELELLVLADNQIKTVPSDFGDARRLKFISLSRNRLEALPHHLLKMGKPMRIDLGGNPMIEAGRIVLENGDETIVLNL
jgi:Leucine-rich repeat (LRR) protein